MDKYDADLIVGFVMCCGIAVCLLLIGLAAAGLVS